MESWTLDHPVHGRILVERGADVEFREQYPDWPEDPPVDDGGQVRRPVVPGPGAGFPARVRARLRNPPMRVQVSVDGRVTGRWKDVGDSRLPLRPGPPPSTLATPPPRPGRDVPQLRTATTSLGELLQVDFREGDTVVEFDPPPGSRAARRREAMASSNLKRLGYPLLTGLGKGGWALLVLVLSPLLDRLLPDWQLPAMPRIHLPVPTRPRIELPTPTLRRIELPTPHPPSLPHLPGWMVWMLDHDRLWQPVLVGLVLGVVAVRNHRRSERTKKSWADGQAPGEPSADDPAAGERGSQGAEPQQP